MKQRSKGRNSRPSQRPALFWSLAWKIGLLFSIPFSLYLLSFLFLFLHLTNVYADGSHLLVSLWMLGVKWWGSPTPFLTGYLCGGWMWAQACVSQRTTFQSGQGFLFSHSLNHYIQLFEEGILIFTHEQTDSQRCVPHSPLWLVSGPFLLRSRPISVSGHLFLKLPFFSFLFFISILRIYTSL